MAHRKQKPLQIFSTNEHITSSLFFHIVRKTHQYQAMWKQKGGITYQFVKNKEKARSASKRGLQRGQKSLSYIPKTAFLDFQKAAYTLHESPPKNSISLLMNYLESRLTSKDKHVDAQLGSSALYGARNLQHHDDTTFYLFCIKKAKSLSTNHFFYIFAKETEILTYKIKRHER